MKEYWENESKKHTKLLNEMHFIKCAKRARTKLMIHNRQYCCDMLYTILFERELFFFIYVTSSGFKHWYLDLKNHFWFVLGTFTVDPPTRTRNICHERFPEENKIIHIDTNVKQNADVKND